MSPEVPTPLIFHCPACRLRLSIDRCKADIRGPCPACGTMVQAPQTGNLAAPSDSPSRRSRQGSRHEKSRSKTRVPVDSIIDHAHLAHRESMKSILVIALFVLAICGCVAATIFLKHWIGR